MTLPDKLTVSLRLLGSEASLQSKVIATFHQWIAARAWDEILIDVADYSHVPGGPGVVLIGSDYNYSMAQRDGDIELACFRKRSSSDRNPLLSTLGRLLEACWLLQEPLRESAVELSTAALRVTVFDRKLTDHHPFRRAEFAWFVAEHLTSVRGERPHVTIADGTARPTVHAAWSTPARLDALLEPLRANGPAVRSSA